MNRNNGKTTGRGMHFEKRVENRLKANFPDSVIIHDVSIPGRKGKQAQIDFVMIDASGVFVIEAKCFSGTVTGSDSDVWWSKEIRDRAGNTFRKPAMNPVRQNETHVKRLKKLVKDSSIPVWSIIVISGKCDFSSIRLSKKTENTYMFHLKNFVQGIRGIMDKTGSCMTEDRITELCGTIMN